MRDRRPYTSQASGLVPPALHVHKTRVAAARRRGIDVIDLGSADARHGPPDAVVERVLARLARDQAASLYSDVPGIEELRQALAGDLGVPVTNVIVAAGANNGVVLSLLATTRAGESITTPVPYFFNHAAQAELLGLDLVPIPTRSADGHRLDVNALEAAMAREEVRAGLVSNPRNPTATLLDSRGLVACAEAAGKPLIIDESYREFAGVQPQDRWRPEGNVIRVGSLSKSFGLAGWRVGYLVVPDAWIEAVLRAQDALMIHAAVASQYIAIEALAHRPADDYVQRFAARVAADQARLREQLVTLPWVESVTGDVATFLWVTLEPSRDADAFAAQLLEQHGVGVLAGSAFGAIEPCIRLGIGCTDSADLARAWDRLRVVA